MAAEKLVGKQVLVRTYSAGCWYGILEEKEKNEVVISNARRLWQWKAGGNGICLSSIAMHGVVQKDSRISEPVLQVWLEAIEIIPCTVESILSLEACPAASA